MDKYFLNTKNKIFLNKQYRMVNEIGNLISELFYEGKLENGNDISGEDSITWIDYRPSQNWPIDQTQIYNDDECDIIKRLVNCFNSINGTNIAIISPYSNQIKRLKELSSNNIKVDTVDGFQGQEADIVIFSMTRTVKPLRFFSDPRRINVAISRAKKNYIVSVYKVILANKPAVITLRL